jgi:8-oxo-dGTP pyrophosphatase MutT (NUDIX family)
MCGTKLEIRELENEGMIPFCPKCEAFRFPQYNVAVSMITVNEATDKILLIQQYGRPSYVLVAGYVTKGESMEDAVRREIREETALAVTPDMTFREEYNYVLWGVVHKRAVYSMAEFAFGDAVTTMENEIFGDWIVPFEEASALLSYDNDRRILALAHERITGIPAEIED